MKNYKLTGFLTILILIVLLMPARNVPSVGIAGLDKVVHMGMFGAVTLSFYYEHYRYKNKLPPFILVFIGIASFGVLTEIMQLFADSRSFDLRDLLADAIGVLLASLLCVLIKRGVPFLKK